MELNLIIILGIIFIALVTKVVVNALKGVIPVEVKAPFPQILSIIVAVGLCILAKLDIFIAFGYGLSIDIVGYVVTGIIASLGAGAVYDLLQQMKDYKEKLAIENNDNKIA